MAAKMVGSSDNYMVVAKVCQLVAKLVAKRDDRQDERSGKGKVETRVDLTVGKRVY